MNKFIVSLVSALAASLAAAPVHAQSWPSKPVRVIVNVAPGGVQRRHGDHGDSDHRTQDVDAAELVGHPTRQNASGGIADRPYNQRHG